MVPASLTGGPHFTDYCERYIRHTKGRWAGRPLVFESWQREFWYEALEFDPATGLRIYQEVGLGLPRKNTKSTMASAAGIYMLDADGEPEPEVLVAAAARNQAGIVMGQSIRMVRASPLLLDRLQPRAHTIISPRNGGVMRHLAADAPLQHGLNPSANIIDELHAHKSGELFTALTTATGAREQPFTLWITTAGVAGHGILGDLYGTMASGPGVLEENGSLRVYRDRANGVLIYWYGAPAGADIEDPAVWMACNPISWLHDGKYLGAQFARLKARGALAEWRRYHLNQFVGIEEGWLEPGVFARGRQDVPLSAALPVGVGIDRSPTGDVAAIVVAQKQGDRVVVRSQLFPAAPVTGLASSEAMRLRLRDLRGAYPLPQVRDAGNHRPIPGPAFAFDRYAFSESAEMLEQDGLNMVDFPMTGAIAPASMTTYELITTGRLLHDGDPVLTQHVENTTAILTERGMRVARPRAGSIVNVACIALVRAVAMAMQEAPKPAGPALPQAVGF